MFHKIKDPAAQRRVEHVTAPGRIDCVLAQTGFRITDALRAGRLDGWERGFEASVTKNLKRPNWCPSSK